MRPRLLVAGLLIAMPVAAGTQAGGQAPAATAMGSVSGRVVSAETEAPIAGATVLAVILTAPPGTSPSPPARTITDADGRFVVRGLTPGRLRLQVMASGYIAGEYLPTSPSMPPSLPPGGNLTDITIRLASAGAIRGTITDDRGAPLANVAVQIYRRGILTVRRAWLIGRTTIVTDAAGRYASESMPPGEYVVKVPVLATTMPRSVVEAVRAGGPGAAAARQTMEYSRAPTPSPAFPIAGDHTILFTSGTDPRPLPEPPAVPDGPSRVYRTTYFPSATTLNDAEIITLGSGEQRDGVNVRLLTARSGRVSGTLIGDLGPAAFTGVHLIATQADERSIDYDGIVALGVTDAAGAFSLLAVPEGQYSLKVVVYSPPPAGRGTPMMPPADRLERWATRDVTVSTDGTQLDPSVLRPPLRVSGRLTFAGAGAASPMMTGGKSSVWMAAVDGGMLSPPAAVPVSADGRFELRGAMSGRYHLWGGTLAGWTVRSVTAGGVDITMAPLLLTDRDVTDVTIALSARAVSASGRVLDAQGAPVVNAHVVVFPADYRQWIANAMSNRTMRSLRTDSSGRFSFAGVPPGNYMIGTLPDGHVPAWPDRRAVEAAAATAEQVLLLEGQPVIRDLTLPPRR